MYPSLGRYIDHTLLRPTATDGEVRQLCREAAEYGMHTVCIFPSHVPLAREMLRNAQVKIATVIAFPFGATFTEAKEAELRTAAARGADEADFVINIGQMKSGDDRAVEQEMQHLTNKARSLGVCSKFIVETAYLSTDEKIRIYEIANRVRPDFMKTSTGYAPEGATVEDVLLMRKTLISEIQIKAAGGIRSYKEAVALLDAGASRLGTSSGIRIIQEAQK